MPYSTRVSLLERIKSGDERAWTDFYENYYRLIFSIGLHYQLTEADCQDLIQQVMVVFFEKRLTFNYQPERGKFRSYLWSVTRNLVGKIKRSEEYQKRSGTAIDFDALPAEQEKNFFDEEWRRCLMDAAMRRLHQKVGDTIFDVFQMYVLQDVAPEVIARNFGIAVSTVYVHKNRCITYLKAIVKDLQENDEDFQSE